MYHFSLIFLMSLLQCIMGLASLWKKQTMLYNSATIQSRCPPFGKAFLDYTYAQHWVLESGWWMLLPQPWIFSQWFLFSYSFPPLLNRSSIELTVQNRSGYICNSTKVTSQLCERAGSPHLIKRVEMSPFIEALYYMWPKVKRVQIILIIDQHRSVGGSEYGWQVYPDDQFGRISGSGWKW